MATALIKPGRTVSQQLDALYDRYGFFTTSNSYFICRDPAKTDRIFSKLRFGSEVSRDRMSVSLDQPRSTRVCCPKRRSPPT